MWSQMVEREHLVDGEALDAKNGRREKACSKKITLSNVQPSDVGKL